MNKTMKARLEAEGYSGNLRDFRDYLRNSLGELYSDWSDEELLLHPEEAIQFCRQVRKHFGLPKLPSDLILRNLTGPRKQAIA